jgi:hypothetical protein
MCLSEPGKEQKQGNFRSGMVQRELWLMAGNTNRGSPDSEIERKRHLAIVYYGEGS